MQCRKTSAKNFFYHAPKTTVNNSTISNFFSTKKNNFITKFNFILHPKGNSTFDFLNDLNRDKYKYPKVKPPFLTKSKRSIKIHKNILNNIKFKKKTRIDSYKLKLSESCEFFNKLNKTFMKDKNILKKTNTKDLIFKDNEENIFNGGEIQYKSRNNKIYKNISLNNKRKNIINLKVQSLENKTSKLNNTNSKQKNEVNIDFLYNKIFPKIFVDHNSDYNIIDNKLNLYYAEDKSHFNNKLKMKNQILMKNGKKLRKMVLDENYAVNKLNEVKKKIGFIKGVTDYSYPDIILKKSKLKNKLINIKKINGKKFKLPCQLVEEEKNKANEILAKSLSEAILIKNRNNINALKISI